MAAVLLAELTATSEAVRDTRSRTVKIERLAQTLRRLGPAEVAIGVAYLSGELRQRQIGVGYRSLSGLPAPAANATLEVAAVDAACERIGAMAGPGSQAARREALAALFAAATEPEQRFLRALVTGELRQGAQAGVMVDAVARAAEVPRDAVRRALMLQGSLGAVAAIAMAEGAHGLGAIGLRVGRPIQRCWPRRVTTSAPPCSARGRRLSSTSSTARACRSTATATRCARSRAASTTSPRACPRSCAPCWRCRRARSSSTARRSRCAPMGARTPSRSPRAASARAAPTGRWS